MNEKSTPLVSVIMPAYNAEKYIQDSIHSVLSQTYENWELIVIDDGSTDGTAEIIKRLSENDDRIRFYTNAKNMGVAMTRNKGLDMATGDFIALLDSDDIWLPQKLERQLAIADKTGVDIIYCSYGMIDEKSEKILQDFIVPQYTDFEKMLIKSVISCSTALLSKGICKNYRFSDKYYHEDYALWMTLLNDGYRAAGDTEVLAYYRLLSGSRASNKINAAKNRWIIYRKYLKLPLVKSVKSIIQYAFEGVRKYH